MILKIMKKRKKKNALVNLVNNNNIYFPYYKRLNKI